MTLVTEHKISNQENTVLPYHILYPLHAVCHQLFISIYSQSGVAWNRPITQYGAQLNPLLPIQLDPMALAVLNDTQSAAVEYVINQSKASSDRVHSALLKKVCRLGYTEDDMER